MSKASKGGKFAHVTPEIVGMVKGVIAESVKHAYSVSRVYAAYNAFFNASDKPQTCPSCLRNRVRDLKYGVAEYEAELPTSGVGTPLSAVEVGAGGAPVPEEEAMPEEEAAPEEEAMPEAPHRSHRKGVGRKGSNNPKEFL